MIPHALILAGGQSRRFGRDKLRLAVGGRSLLSHGARRLQAAGFIPILLTRGPPPLEMAHVPWLGDGIPDEGPLMALAGALARLREERFLVVAGDMPSLPMAVARLLWTSRPAALVTILDHSPLPGVYHRALLPVMRSLLARGERSLRAVIRNVAPDTVVRIPAAEWRCFDPDGETLVNINDPADWRRFVEDLHTRGPTLSGKQPPEKR
ncbi:MAG: molybdenum cofactor guanylyltransferase [Deltaproteobacteria bacterium]|nr:molybdenum cofactor guanylyltransferase [Deltaproteobacteria bacterium]